MVGTQNTGKDFNFFKTVTAIAGNWPLDINTEPDVLMRFRGARRIMFVCASGTNIEYSFNGNTMHGRISADQIFTFDIRNEDKIWFRGSGEVDVHAWRA